ncbi:terminase small subunit [Aliidiomarina maris]|uniref:Terminase small subunit n=1 Tax=Aliidiomarina maris TaxID=531312 RepID=A0A327X6H1_9GAMM|nr:terminase small subunit [Aliidiomarina maris]RAK01614.1 phage terminase small subunit [Aliidiomarina maris]RUO28440.1 terminase small subunit [Aliidiomarina maris]
MPKISVKEYDWTDFTDKERLFCYEYPIDKNATKAAKRAGYSANSASKIGWELLQKDKLRDRIDEMMADTFQKLELNRENIIQELLALAMSDIGEMFNPDGTLRPLHEIPAATRRAISAIDVDELFEGKGDDREQIGYTKKLRLWDKPKSLELLGKHLKMFTDKVELSQRPKVYRRDMTGRKDKGEES